MAVSPRSCFPQGGHSNPRPGGMPGCGQRAVCSDPPSVVRKRSRLQKKRRLSKLPSCPSSRAFCPPSTPGAGRRPAGAGAGGRQNGIGPVNLSTGGASTTAPLDATVDRFPQACDPALVLESLETGAPHLHSGRALVRLCLRRPAKPWTDFRRLMIRHWFWSLWRPGSLQACPDTTTSSDRLLVACLLAAAAEAARAEQLVNYMFDACLDTESGCAYEKNWVSSRMGTVCTSKLRQATPQSPSRTASAACLGLPLVARLSTARCRPRRAGCYACAPTP
jgi:hypothetical protein